MDMKSTVKTVDEEVQADPLLLFQRLVSVETWCDSPALVESRSMIRPATKDILEDTVWSSAIEESTMPTGQSLYALDGGPLIHKIFFG